MTNYLAKKSYLAIKVEAVENTPIKPDVFIPLISESVRSILNREPDNRMAGLDWKSDELLKGRHTHEGTLELYCDADTLGHILNMTYKKGVTAGDAADGYTHPFTAADPKSYSIEIQKGLYAQRFWGVKADNLKLEFDNNKMKATIDIKAVGQVSTAKLAVALTGAAMTEMVLSQDYVLKPTEGIKAGDVITTGGVALTITVVEADGVTLTFGATTVTAAIGDSAYLTAQTYSYVAAQEPLFEGNALVGVGVDDTAADTAAGSKATATPFQEFVLNLKNNMLQQATTGQHDPIKILPQVKEAQITAKKLFDSVDQHEKWLALDKQAMTVVVKGKFIKADRTTWELLTINLYKIKLMPNINAVETGEYIYDEQTFEILYDRTDDKAIAVSLVNNTAGTSYGD